MGIEQKILNQVTKLIKEGASLSKGNEYGQTLGSTHISSCKGWLASADHVVSLVSPSPISPYRNAISSILIEAKCAGYTIHNSVGDLTAVLERLANDIQAGLLETVANQTRVETFDDMLDHAEEYKKKNMKEGAGVLASAVFEDTIRRIARINNIQDIGTKLDELISALSKETLTSIVAKRCRASADIRNKALHANWDEFTMQDVEASITLTRELLAVISTD